MKETIIHKIESLRALVIGFLLVFVVIIGRELIASPVMIVVGLGLMALAVWFAKKTAHHFHGDHHHAGDSLIDAVPVVMLFIANIFHPAVDGLSWYEITVSGGVWVGILFGASIVLHEIIRQSALIAAFRLMSIKWYWVVSTAIAGIVAGISAGYLNATFFHDYEIVADLVTLFAYVFIISEFHFAHKGHGNNKTSALLVVTGIVLGGILAYTMHAH